MGNARNLSKEKLTLLVTETKKKVLRMPWRSFYWAVASNAFNPGDGIRWISDAVWALSADSPNATGRQAGPLEAPVNSRRIRDF
jgi:hypothetical protein